MSLISHAAIVSPTGQTTMSLICQSAEVGIDERDDVFDQSVSKRGIAHGHGAAPAAPVFK